jgi:RNA polymerase sigma factor (sigma-70 family)
MHARELTDEQLLTAWVAGDRIAGNELVGRHFALVHRFFRNKVSSDLDDLVQQTFLGCVEARARYEHRSRFVAFLLGIARHQLFDYYYRRRTRGLLDTTLTGLTDLSASPPDLLAERDEQRLLADALQRLPREGQAILELAYWDGLHGNEIADVLDIPLNTAYTRLRRAKQSLRELFLDAYGSKNQSSISTAKNRSPSTCILPSR